VTQVYRVAGGGLGSLVPILDDVLTDGTLD